MKQVRTLKPYKPVKLIWKDSTRLENWMYASDLEQPVVLKDIATIGFVVHNTPEYVTITHTAMENGSVLGLLAIPWGCVSFCKPLGKAKVKRGRR